jgi:hypothetical protein
MQHRIFFMFAALLFAAAIANQGCATYPDPSDGPANAAQGKRR